MPPATHRSAYAGPGARAASAEGSATLTLNERFLFSHEPISERIPLRLLERNALVQDFKMRVRYSTGGAFLITGFRGVGKTSFITYALEQLERETRSAHILPIYINLSRRLTATEIMHHIVRQMHSELEARGLYRRFELAMRALIETAHQRTAYTISASSGVSTSAEGAIAPPGFSGITLGWKGSRTTKREQALEFLGYDDKAAEYDIIRILRGLNRGYRRRLSRALVPIRPIIVFDELDKLDLTSEDGRTYLLDLISTLKAILTTSGSIFIFIGGKDLYRLWLADQRAPDSVYESVFAHDMYLPCLWNLSEPLLDSVLSTQNAQTQPELVQWRDKLRDHLAYTGRGIARRMMRELNQLVSLDSGHLAIRLSPTVQQRVRFYADIEALINENINQILQSLTERISSDAQFDDYRQFLYFIADYMLRSGGRPFTLESAIGAFKDYPLYRENPGTSEQLLKLFLDTLARAHYLETAGDGSPAAIEYRLTGWALGRMRRAMKFGDFEYAAAPDLPYGGRIGPYRLTEILGAGGIADVFEAQDATGRVVAVKALRARNEPAWMELATQVMAREREILSQRIHPNIVTLLDDGARAPAAPIDYFALELVRGISLLDVIRGSRKGLPPEDAATIIRALCEVVGTLNLGNYYRLDLTPSNVILETGSQKRLVLIDVGTAVSLRPGAINRLAPIGTPGYMAPEVAAFQPDPTGAEPDLTLFLGADVYALGIMLYLLLVGPRGMSALQGAQNINPDWLPEEFRSVIAQATAQEPTRRMDAFTLALSLPPSPPIDEVIARLQGVRVDRKAGPAEPQDKTGIEVDFGADDEITNIFVGAPPRPAGSAGSASAAPEPVRSEALSDVAAIDEFGGPPASVPGGGRAAGPIGPLPTVIRSIALQIEYAPEGFTGVTYTLHFALTDDIRIGRASDNTVVLEDKAVSRYNATIVPGTGFINTPPTYTYYLIPMRDSAPMIIDGEPLPRGQPSRVLQHGSVIQIGSTFITFLYSAEPVIPKAGQVHPITSYPVVPASLAPPPPNPDPG